MSPPRSVAVLGAGYVGRALAEACAAAGDRVWAVRRSATAGAEGGLTWLAGDIATGRVAGLPDRLDAVALTVAPGRGGDDYEATYVRGAEGALALARRHGARTLAYTSSTGVYGRDDGAWVDEDTPPAPRSPDAEALLAAERVLLAARDVAVTVLRVAGIYGPGRDARRRFEAPERLPQRGEYWVNLAHRDDIVAALRLALARAEGPRLLNCADGSPTRAADVARWCAARRGIDPATLAFTGDAPRARSDQRVRADRLRALGWTPRYPSFREGFAA